MPEKKAKRATEARKATTTLRSRKTDPSKSTKAAKPVARRAVRKPAEAPSTSPAAAPGISTLGVHRGHRKTKVGRVMSAKTPKTVIVEVERLREHPLYKKVIRVRRRFPSHDATGEVKAGDVVRIQESRPFSATKRFEVIEVLSRVGEAFAAAPDEADIERALEETEGVSELLAKPEREIAEPSPEEASVALPEEDAEVGDGSRVRAKGANTKV